MSLMSDSRQALPVGESALAWHIVKRAPRIAHPCLQAALWQQVQRGALDFVGLIAVIGSLAGFLTIATVELRFGLGIVLGVRVLVALILGPLASFVSALLLVTGPGAATTFELGLMRYHGELRTLRLIGIDPRDFLVLPRVVGFSLSLFVLTFTFQSAAVLGGFALAAAFTQISFAQHFDALVTLLQPSRVIASVLTTLFLGAVLGVLVCHQGLAAPFSPTEMPRIARELLSRSLVVVVIVLGAANLLLS